MKLTEHFNLDEFLVSKTYPELLKNIHISDQYKWNLFKLSAGLLEHIRKSVNRPITIVSGYRTPELNKRIGGRRDSQHLFGEAVDFVIIGSTGNVDQINMRRAIDYAKEHLIYFTGELIEYQDVSTIRFCHISLPDPRWVSVFRVQKYDGK